MHPQFTFRKASVATTTQNQKLTAWHNLAALPLGEHVKNLGQVPRFFNVR